MRRSARTDRNQGDIVAALRKVGASVQSLAPCGMGVPDLWACAQCGITKRGTAHQKRQTYCSRPCMALAYAQRLLGQKNPNHKNAGNKTCVQCGAAYHSYNKTSKFCSHSCYCASKPDPWPKPVKVKPDPKPKPPPKEKRLRAEKACVQCGQVFKFSPSQSSKRFCSYKCHLESGGAFRAGIASKRATMKYGAKKDANHNEIFDVIKEHCAVYDLSSAGCGVPDGAAYVNETWQLFDVKNPKTAYGRRGLNPVQKKWAANWRGGPVYLIYTPGEAKEFALGNFCDLKVVTPEIAAESLEKKKM